MNDLIKKLVESFGPSGFEEQTRALIREEIAEHVDELSVDAMGNLIALKNGDGSGRKVMVAAHMDEIGLMATHITAEGYIRFTNIGGILGRVLAGNRVQFADGTIGVIDADPVDSRLKVHPLKRHFIDVGATSREDCPIQVGAPAGFKRDFLAQGNRLTAKSMDDRIGCVIAIEALKRLENCPHDVYFVFSVQEEIGVRGAAAAANAIHPEVGIALDVTRTGDTPEATPMSVALGKGAAIKAKDSGMIAHAGLVKLMRQRAEEGDIPYQIEVLDGGSTDARAMQIAGPGSASGCISIPCRYVHTQSETVDKGDVTACVDLLTAILNGPIEL